MYRLKIWMIYYLKWNFTKDFNGDSSWWTLPAIIVGDACETAIRLKCNGRDGPLGGCNIADHVVSPKPHILSIFRSSGLLHRTVEGNRCMFDHFSWLVTDECLARRIYKWSMVYAILQWVLLFMSMIKFCCKVFYFKIP